MIMNKIRPKQKRSLSLEVLEGRLTLSTGLAVTSPHTHALVRSLTQHKIQAAFKGHTSINGQTELIPDLTGRIGNNRFTGYGTGTISNNIVQSGDVYLSNSQGSLHLQFGTASVIQVGKRSRQEVPVVVLESTGKDARLTGMTGMLTTWNIPASPNRTSTFSGFLDLA
jgi:hypothetical protein